MNLFEANIVLWIQDNLRVPALNGIVSLISHFGDAGIFWIVVTVLLLIFKKTRKLGICCAMSMIAGLIIVNGCLKPIVARIRPYNLPEMVGRLTTLVPAEHDFSFPSGHSTNSFACAVVLFRMDKKRFGIPALVLAILIALSRLYVGVHYPTDVICGVIIGSACSIACTTRGARRLFFKWMRKIGLLDSKKKKRYA